MLIRRVIVTTMNVSKPHLPISSSETVFQRIQNTVTEWKVEKCKESKPPLANWNNYLYCLGKYRPGKSANEIEFPIAGGDIII